MIVGRLTYEGSVDPIGPAASAATDSVRILAVANLVHALAWNGAESFARALDASVAMLLRPRRASRAVEEHLKHDVYGELAVLTFFGSQTLMLSADHLHQSIPCAV